MHSQYEELCALAVTGQATDSELALLDGHLGECEDCRTLVELADLRGSRLGPSLAELFQVDAEPPSGMRDRFLRRAADEGLEIQVGRSIAVAEGTPAEELRASWFHPAVARQVARCWESFCGWRPSPAFSLAGVCLVVGLAAGTLVGLRREQGAQPEALQVAGVVEPQPPARTVEAVPVAMGLDRESADRESAELRERLAALSARLAVATEKESALEASNSRLQASLDLSSQQVVSASAARDNELKLRSEQGAEIAGLRQQLDETRSKMAVLDAISTEQEKRTTDAQARLAQAKQEMDQLYAARSASETMIASRNLHIVDVYDDTGNARQRAFGRVFYVEGKSLVFYAYDLPSPKRDKNFSFQLWGEGPGLAPTTYKLGLMRPDGNGHGQWVVACDDPKVLNQLRGVFIAPATEGSGPPSASKKLMYALLGTANHP